MISERSLRVLELPKIRTMLADLAVTDMGRQLCMALSPFTDAAQVQDALDLTEEANVLLARQGSSPISPFPDVRPMADLAGKGSMLNPKALLDVACSLRVARDTRSAFREEDEALPRLTALAGGLEALRELEGAISDAILSEEELSDRASPTLFDIRRRIRQANERIRDKLNSMAHGGAYAKYLQDSIVTVRNGRYVLAVKQEYRQSVPGLIHDQSSTGSTLFIEPMAVVEMGNELKELSAKERAEIERILYALSARVGEARQAIAQNIHILISLDFVFAKGRLARQMYAVMPRINTQGVLQLKQVRHPLIDPARVVPCDLHLGDSFTTLVITGPNTGGKTVTLKTVGLITLMAQCGLEIPAELGTELCVFENVFADIGDEQSIEQSLSTFSSHMSNIVHILSEVTDRDLVLFDELGAGTDPTEGAALAQTILDRLLRRRIRTVATTHYSELKAYALTRPGAENASVEFDVATLRPTYHLSIGVPGKSNAFAISQRLGLPEDIIEEAKGLLSANDVRFEDVIAGAELEHKTARKEREAADAAMAEAIRLRTEAEQLHLQAQQTQRAAERKAKEEGRRIIEKARRDAEDVIQDLKQMKKAGGTSGEINALRGRLKDAGAALSDGLEAGPQQADPPKAVREGDTVHLLTLNTQGTVLAPADARGEVLVQAGRMKTRVPLSQLRLVEEKKEKKRTTVSVHTGSAARTVHMECDVRGMNLGEALMEVDEYLDQATLAGLHEVSIIHGKGTGTLRSGIHQHLKKHPLVDAYRLGKFGEGEDGVTVVTLR